MEDKIIKHYNSATLEQISNGMSWYENAYNESLLISQVLDIDIKKAVGVVAALSPNNKWNRNIIDAWSLIAEPSLDTKCCTFPKQRQKAIDIINGSGREHEILNILRGTKTMHFYTNILYFDTSQTVTVDMWAYRSVGLEPKNKFYKQVEVAYQNVAKTLGILPHQLQAVVWGIVRGKSV